MSKEFELSRRKALLGLGSVGVASAGAGFGTSAYFSDQEEFVGNSIQAGEFGLTAELNQDLSSVDQDGMGDLLIEDSWAQNLEEGGAEVGFPIEIQDAKPGDTFDFCWDLTIEENPGHIKVFGEEQEDKDGEDNGVDLPQEIDELKTLGASDNVRATISVGKLGEAADYQQSETYEGLTAFFGFLEDGWVLVDDGGDPLEVEVGETVAVCIKVEILTDAGNEIQGATHESTLRFYAEQARHNEDFGED